MRNPLSSTARRRVAVASVIALALGLIVAGGILIAMILSPLTLSDADRVTLSLFLGLLLGAPLGPLVAIGISLALDRDWSSPPITAAQEAELLRLAEQRARELAEEGNGYV